MKHSSTIRTLSLLFFLGLMTWLGYRHQVLGGGPAGIPPVDAMCPFGGLEALFGYFNDGTWLRRVAPSALVLFGATALMSVLLGRVFCGWICPLGALTEFTSRLARKLGFKPRTLPDSVDRPLRLLKYVLLVVIIALTWATGELVFRPYDPWMAWMHLSAGFSDAEIASLILLACLLAEFFISRAWCTYFCPLGAVFGLFQRIAPVKIRRNANACISCNKCNRACPTRLTPATLETVTSPDCLACGACVEACPKADALHFALPGQRRILPVLLVGLLGIGIFGSVYIGSKLTGFWATAAPAAKSSNPAASVFGWMNLQQHRQNRKPARSRGHLHHGTPCRRLAGNASEKTQQRRIRPRTPHQPLQENQLEHFNFEIL